MRIVAVSMELITDSKLLLHVLESIIVTETASNLSTFYFILFSWLAIVALFSWPAIVALFSWPAIIALFSWPAIVALFSWPAIVALFPWPAIVALFLWLAIVALFSWPAIGFCKCRLCSHPSMISILYF